MLDGLSHIKALVKHAKNQGMSALGLTDHGVMHGAIDFYEACVEEGIKPIIGCELYVASTSLKEKNPAEKTPSHLTVLAQNAVGYSNLLHLVSKANTEGFYYKPRVDKELLSAKADGLIVLSGCPSSEISRFIIDGENSRAEELVRFYRDSFSQFYLELQRHENLEFLERLNSGLINIAEKLDIPLIATNDLHYVYKEDADMQDVMVCIQTNTTINDQSRMKMSDDSYYLKSPEEMAYLFSDMPEALSNTMKVAESVDFELDFTNLHLPEYPVENADDADSFLRRLSWQGFEQKFGPGNEVQHQRLTYELDVITKTQYPNYFLVVWDIAEFARKNQIIFGVRGSAASSLVLYCLGVTDIDPLEYELVFERFLNIERKEMPDIDLDFQDDRRDEAIRYLVSKYGEDHVAQIITFGTLGAKAVIRDVGRALGMQYADVDRIARLVPARVGMTLETAFSESAELREAYQNDESYKELLSAAQKLEGTVRNSSTHAAGIVISSDPLTNNTPLQRPTKGAENAIAMTQYAMEPLAKLGLLKMDFLGLINYTILAETISLVETRHGVSIPLNTIEFDDVKTFELLGSGETTAVFQLESPGMRRYIKELKPETLAELAAMVALYRPGPMEHIPRFIDSKFGRAPIEYPHDALKGILEETFGIIVYQDQVLHILRTFAGYSLGEADIVRKAMGKKIRSLMEEEREKFVSGAKDRGYTEQLAKEIFDLIEPFAGYAFNKAHSVSYAVVAYWTAFFKANYPAEFMTCAMNAYSGNAERISMMVAECVRLGIKVLPPEINRSEVGFSVKSSPSIKNSDSQKEEISYGLASVKNVGELAVSDLVSSRKAEGVFKNLEDFARRSGGTAGNRRVLESLIKVGALDEFGRRGQLLASLDSLVSLVQREAQLKESGQTNMFNLFGESVPAPMVGVTLSESNEPSAIEQALWERELMGVSLSSQILESIAPNVPEGAIISKSQLEAGMKVALVGQISNTRLQTDKNGERIAFVTLELMDGSLDVAVWSRTYQTTTDVWIQGNLVHLNGTVRVRNDELTMHCDGASVYEIPSDNISPPAESFDGPRIREWTEEEFVESIAATAPSENTNSPIIQDGTIKQTPQGQEELLDTEAPVISTVQQEIINPEPQANSSMNGHIPVPAIRNAKQPSNNNIGVSSEIPNKLLLVNLTETDKPEDDQYLLKSVLQVILEYPGADDVDLVISSGGKRWRVEMRIIKTSYSDELANRLAELLDNPRALTIQKR